jgi:hypothetical protein
VEIGVNVKLTRAQVGIAGVVDSSSWTNTKFMAVSVDKGAVSQAHGNDVEGAGTPRLVIGVVEILSMAWSAPRLGPTPSSWQSV